MKSKLTNNKKSWEEKKKKSFINSYLKADAKQKKSISRSFTKEFGESIKIHLKVEKSIKVKKKRVIKLNSVPFEQRETKFMIPYKVKNLINESIMELIQQNKNLQERISKLESLINRKKLS